MVLKDLNRILFNNFQVNELAFVGFIDKPADTGLVDLDS